jgi:ABC-type lipoprotein release transport system permease subunit
MKFFIYYGITVIFIGVILGILFSCTYSINMVHTQGQASDVVEETQSAEPDIKTDFSIPATAL